MIYLNLGRRRVGKTTLARYMAHARRPQIVIDPRAQWAKRPNAKFFSDVSAEDVESMLDTLDAGLDVVCQPEDLEFSVNRLAVVARTYLVNDETETKTLTVVADECGLYNLRAWSWMMRCSPYDRTSIILTAHRPRDIDPTIRALADKWCIFRTTQEHDLEVIESRCGEETKNHVQLLDNYQFVCWDDAVGEMTIHKNSASWFTPDAAPLVGEKVPEKKRERMLWDS